MSHPAPKLVPGTRLEVIKRNLQQVETWRYTGVVLAQDETSLLLEAYFDRQDMDFHGMRLGHGDRFLETYYLHRWYNIFEIHARQDDHLRGWYCNIAQPMIYESPSWRKPAAISYIDLALDLLVFPDGRQLVLDEDEFAALDITPGLRLQARAALAELQALFKARLTSES
jgi:hypothetical protein